MTTSTNTLQHNDEQFAGFSDIVRTRLQTLFPLSDCSLYSCDGLEVPTHKFKLIEQSTVLRDLISEVHSGGVRLSEDDPTLRLLIEGLYDANMAVSEENLEPLLELSRKYDVADLRLNCNRFLDVVPLTAQNLPLLLLLSCSYNASTATLRCQQFVQTAGQFDELVRQHGWGWLEVLPATTVVQLLSKQIETERASSEGIISELRSEKYNLKRSFNNLHGQYKALYNSASLTEKVARRFKP